MAQTIGRYEIQDEIGRGGMATVYLAFDPRFKRQVAVKVLPRQFTHDPRFLARFEQEAQTIATLEDPAIVPVYDFGEEDDAPYIVMRHMNGGTLRERISGRPLPLEEIKRILNRLAPALDLAHRMGVIHRDLKPDNVLFDEQNRPYLADFGIARMAEATHTMTIVGTPAYMSPEQAQGKLKLDWRSDIYALGVILFEMLSGRQPYKAETPAGQMMMQIMEPVPQVWPLNSKLPAAAQAVIDQAMAKDRKQRYQSAADLAGAVEALGAADSENVLPQVALLAAVDPAVVLHSKPPTAEKIAAPDVLQEDQAVGINESASDAGGKAKTGSGGSSASMARTPRRRTVPAWAWWLGALALVIFLVMMIRAAFFDGPGSPSSAEATSTALVALLPPGSDTPLTQTAVSQATQTPTTTPFPTQTPIPTPTLNDEALIVTRIRPADQKTMVYVPAGSFAMGSTDGGDDESPVHNVSLEAFWIDRSEVTNDQFAHFVEESGFETSAEKSGGGFVFTGDDWEYTSGADWQHPAGPQSNLSGLGDHPVVLVSWTDAAAYCAWAAGALPSEAQWEYAARGEDAHEYPWGDVFDGEKANYCDNRCPSEIRAENIDDGFARTAPVESFADGKSWVGAQDMAGNVAEWINDWYDGTYYSESPTNNPGGPQTGTTRVLRGGAWIYSALTLRGADRAEYDPHGRGDAIGFRCVVPDR